MLSPIELEREYRQILQHLDEQPVDEVVTIDLTLLEQLDLLEDEASHSEEVTNYFHVLETPDKLTLFNEQFVVWIVPQLIEHEPTTVALIGILHGEQIDLELAFTAAGVYNSSRMVLQVLERLLQEIRENEELMGHLEDSL